jgi:NADH dehydrogenase
MVTGMDSSGIDVRNDEGSSHIEADAVFWAAGVRGSSMGSILREKTRSELDKSGRIVVEPDLTLPGHSNIFIVGDLACAVDQATGVPLPSVAPVAQQQGRYVGKHLKATLQGKRMRPFRYRNRGMLAVIGRSAAVADFGRIRLQGFAAWLVWVFVHIMEIVEFENRLLVFVQWVWQYVNKNRSARIVYPSRSED